MEEDDDERGDPPTDGDAGKKKKPRKKKKKSKEVEEDVAQHGENGDDAYGAQYPAADVTAIPPEEWVDITDLCQLASKGMQLGEMIESPQFRLFDAMSAIEIMDPKMDSGFNSEADMTLERAEEKGILAQSLSHEELVAIWDQLLMYYLLWLEGHTIVQTAFCCLYLHDLERHAKPVPLLGTFVDAFLVACRTARAAVLKAGVFEDEDFLPSLFGIDLEACVFSANPTEVRERLDRERKALPKGSAADSKAAVDAAAARLEFIGEYMLALSELHCAPEGGAGAAKNAKRRQESAQRRLTACLGLLERLEQTSLAPSPDALRCFDPSTNRRLLVPGPPRTVEPIQDPKVVMGMWTSHIHELLLCGALAQKPLVLILNGGAVCHKGEPNVLPRSVAHLRASEEGLLRNMILDSLETYLFPREALQHCKKVADAFVGHCELLLMHLTKLAHKNRARRFRQLAHVFADFNALQHEAWQLDEDLKKTFGANLRHPRPCWIWVMEHCLQMMISKLLLGFELELYDEAEYHMIYWYVDYLYGLRIYNLNELYHSKEQPAGGPKTKPGQRPKKDTSNNLKGGLRPKNPPAFLLLLEAAQALVRGLFRLLAFTLRRGLLAVPPQAKKGLDQRFVLRFRSLEHFRLPHLPSFKDFEQSSASAEAPIDNRVVLDAAQVSFSEAAQLLEKASAAKERDGPNAADSVPSLEDAKTLRRVLVANQLAVTQLLRNPADGSAQVTATTVHHPHLVSVQVTPKAASANKGGYPAA